MIKSSTLKGRHRCSISRGHTIDLWDRKTILASIPVTCRKVLKRYLDGSITRAEVPDELREEFSHIAFLSEEQREKMLEAKIAMIDRYIDAEEKAQASRTRYYIKPVPQVVNIFGTPVETTPDALFYDEGRIEAVKYFFKAPDIAQFGKKADKTVARVLEILCFWKYAKNFASFSNDEVFGGYVYLDSDEVKGFGEISPDNKLVRGLVLLAKDEKTAEDIYENEWKGYLLGSCEGDCSTCGEFCPWKNAGNYTEPAAPRTEKSEGKKLVGLSLSKAQEDAISFSEGIGKVKAGAGAGKTLVLTLRVMSLIMNGANPEDLLLITFTVNGAEEMRQRLIFCFDDYGLDPKDVDKIKITTFNAFAQEVVKDNYESLGYTEAPDVVDSIIRKNIIIEAIAGHVLLGVNYKNFENPFGNGGFDTVSDVFDYLKSYNISIYNWDDVSNEDIIHRASVPINKEWMEVYTKFNELLKDRNLLEYNDQQPLLEQIILDDPYYIENHYGFSHIIVDEFQDSTAKEVDLLKHLMDSKKFKSLFVVGDDAQNIFESMRHTDNHNIIDFGEVIGEEVSDFVLSENYRSTPEIIDEANKINNRRRDKIPGLIDAKRPSAGEPVQIHAFAKQKREYKFIGENIEDLIGKGIRPEHIAFIAKDGSELKLMADELASREIPSQMLTPESVIKNSRVIACCGVAEFINNPEVTQGAFDYLNAISHGDLFKKTDAEILDAIENFKKSVAADTEAHGKMSTFLKAIEALDETDETYKQFADKVRKNKSFDSILAYCNAMMRLGAKEKYRKKAYSGNGVILTTVHSSKGLEWPYVFVSITKIGKSCTEEDRRILFTAVTRAKDLLVVTTTVNKKSNIFAREIFEDLGKPFVLDDANEKEEDILEDLEESKRVDELIREARKKADEMREQKALGVEQQDIDLDSLDGDPLI